MLMHFFILQFVAFMCMCFAVLLTGTWPLMMTSSAKRTFTGLVFNLAFLAALINADLGDFWRGRRGVKKQKKDNQLVLR